MEILKVNRIISLIFAGCFVLSNISTVFSMSARPYYYNVMIYNSGNDEIQLLPFELCENEKQLISFGMIQPKGRKSLSPFFYAPKRLPILKWKNIVTGEFGEAQAIVELPKSFTKTGGRGINFYIDPDKASIRVTFDILDSTSGIVNEIGGDNVQG
jgi:hypothetical protein